MQRVPEPDDLMDDAAQAEAYAAADFSAANNLFVELIQRDWAPPLRGHLLDLGCGPADIPLALARANPGLHIDAVDGAKAMLDLAQRRLDAAPGLGAQIRLLCAYLPCADLAATHYHAVCSNSLLHHLKQPLDLWLSVRHCARPGALITVMDLARPVSALAVDSLVETYALQESDILRRDFRNSLFAAYTPDEVNAQLREAGLPKLRAQMVSDRHWAVCGRL